MNRLSPLLACAILIMPLAACGKKAQPGIRAGETNAYPRAYPAPNNGDPATINTNTDKAKATDHHE
jgi:hypothetical protein